MYSPALSYSIYTRVNLSLEDFHYAGLTSEETKEVIQRLPNPTSANCKLRCEPTGINRNWSITLYTSDAYLIDWTVEMIDIALRHELEKKI